MNYLFHIGIMLGIYGMLALSANLLIGFGGLLTMAQAAFYEDLLDQTAPDGGPGEYFTAESERTDFTDPSVQNCW